MTAPIKQGAQPSPAAGTEVAAGCVPLRSDAESRAWLTRLRTEGPTASGH